MKEIKIGRSSKNDIAINESSVSRIHASIVIDGNSIYVIDHGSTNGTYINGQRIRGRHPLKNDDILKVGNSLVQWKNALSRKPKDSVERNDAKPNAVQPPIPPTSYSHHSQFIPPKQTSSTSFIIVGALALILLVGFVVLSDMMPARWVRYMISPAKPNVISNSKEGIPLAGFDYQFEVKAKIINDGNEGYVKIKTIIYECDKTYNRETKVKMRKGEIYTHDVVFDEVEFLNTCITKSEILVSATY